MFIKDAFEWLVANKDTANSIATISSASIALAAVILSIVSIWIARSTLKSQQAHNKLSVRPLAYIMIGDYEGRIFVKVCNHGTGPMIINSVTVIGATEPSKPLIQSMPLLGPKIAWTNFVENCSGRSVPVGGEIDLLDFTFQKGFCESEYQRASSQIRRILGDFEICVKFTDIYGSDLPLSQRSLKFFHRLLT
jgi:hypothetical protein